MDIGKLNYLKHGKFESIRKFEQNREYWKF